MQHDLTLPGPVVSLEPLHLLHAEGWAALADSELYQFHTSPPPLDVDTAAANIRLFLDNPVVMAFAVLDSATGELRGVTSFYDHAPVVPRVEIGNTVYGRCFWGGATNPHVKLLMLTYAFASWRCARVALRCDADNTRSANAIARLGARAEGVLRGHRRRHDGTVADTAYYSVLREEWPDVRAGLMTRLEPGE